jgi:hypothetical protein
LRCSMVSLVSCDENKPRVSLNMEAWATQSWDNGIPESGREPGPHKSTQRRTVVAIATSSSKAAHDSVTGNMRLHSTLRLGDALRAKGNWTLRSRHILGRRNGEKLHDGLSVWEA